MLKFSKLLKFLLIVSVLCYLDETISEDLESNEPIPIIIKKLKELQEKSHFVIDHAQKSIQMLNNLLTRPPLAVTYKRIEQNFALSSSGAKLVEQKGGIFSGSSCLSKSKDQYTSFHCSAKNMSQKSITIGLAEDALVQKIGLYFFESFSSRVKSFSVQVSLDGDHLNWLDGGRHIAHPTKRKQTFTLPKESVARLVKITFEDSYDSPYHYCTISQIVVNGKTYSSYAAQQTKKVLTEELINNINSEFEKDQLLINEVFEKQNQTSQNLIVDLKTHFQSYVKKKSSPKNLKLRFLKERTTCLIYEDLFMQASQQCSPNEYLSTLIETDGGPLESYFHVMDLKIKKIEKMTETFKEEMIVRYQKKISTLKEEERQILALENKAAEKKKSNTQIRKMSKRRIKRILKNKRRSRMARRRRSLRLIARSAKSAEQAMLDKIARDKQEKIKGNGNVRHRYPSKNTQSWKQLQFLNMKLDQVQQKLKKLEQNKSEINFFNMINNPHGFVLVPLLILFIIFFSLVIIEGFTNKASNILKPSNWGISLAKIRNKNRLKIFSSTKGSKKWEKCEVDAQIGQISQKFKITPINNEHQKKWKTGILLSRHASQEEIYDEADSNQQVMDSDEEDILSQEAI